MATDTVRRLFESQQELLVTHEAMRAGQADVFTSVANNVKELQQEKALIATGNQQLAQLAEKIRAELSEFTWSKWNRWWIFIGLGNAVYGVCQN